LLNLLDEIRASDESNDSLLSQGFEGSQNFRRSSLDTQFNVSAMIVLEVFHLGRGFRWQRVAAKKAAGTNASSRSQSTVDYVLRTKKAYRDVSFLA